MEGFASERQRKTLTFTRQDTAIGRPCSHHGDQVEALGNGPEVVKKRVEGKMEREEEKAREEGKMRWWGDEQEEKEEEKEAVGKQGGGTRVMGEKDKAGEVREGRSVSV